MFSKFFITRPNFAIVIAIVITLAGLVSLAAIPVAQYPNVTPPQVTIYVTYPGASAQTIVNTVAEPIEEQVNGAPGEIYMQSSSASSGIYSLTVTFAIGTDPNIDQVNVQNRVQIAEAQLPPRCSRRALPCARPPAPSCWRSASYSPDNSLSQLTISNYAYMHLQQIVARIPGVGTRRFSGAEYAMRVWLNPVQMTGLEHYTAQVISAIQAQNIQVSAGQIGEPPVSGRPAAAINGAGTGRTHQCG